MASERKPRFRRAILVTWDMDKCPVDTIENNEWTHKWVKYIIAGREICPDTGRPHWQSVIHFHKQVVIDKIWEILGEKEIKLITQYGSNKQAIEYCKKDEEWTEWGTPSKQGERNDIPSMEEMEKFATIEDLEQEINPTTYCRYKRNIDEMFKTARIRKLRRIADGEFTAAELRPWQQNLIENIPESRRKVTWVWEAEGNTGKTFLAEYMRVHHEALISNSTSFKDVAYLYDGHPYVIFDLTRSDWDPNYVTIEAFTNPSITSTKYEPVCKPCVSKVLVFSNGPPDLSKLSQDRWNIIHVT